MLQGLLLSVSFLFLGHCYHAHGGADTHYADINALFLLFVILRSVEMVSPVESSFTMQCNCEAPKTALGMCQAQLLPSVTSGRDICGVIAFRDVFLPCEPHSRSMHVSGVRICPANAGADLRVDTR